jgi:hypothetical protein
MVEGKEHKHFTSNSRQCAVQLPSNSTSLLSACGNVLLPRERKCGKTIA